MKAHAKSNAIPQIRNLLTKITGLPRDEMEAELAGFIFSSTKAIYRDAVRIAFFEGGINAITVNLLHVLVESGFNKQKIVANCQKSKLDSAPARYSRTLEVELKGARLFKGMIQKLLRYYSEDRVLTLVMGQQNAEYLLHTPKLLTYIESNKKALGEFTFLPKKPKSILSLFWEMEELNNKLSLGDFPLGQKEDTQLLHGEQVEGFDIVIPQTHYDLVKLGEALRFCIGNGDYSREVSEGKAVVALYKQGKPAYAFQFSPYRVLEAQGFANQAEVPAEIMSSLKSMFTITPTKDSQFIPITDSYWVNGYRYDGTDLFLLLKETVYVYKNVPLETYETLLDSRSKGAYVNKWIKKNYDCEKLANIEEVEMV